MLRTALRLSDPQIIGDFDVTWYYDIEPDKTGRLDLNKPDPEVDSNPG